MRSRQDKRARALEALIRKAVWDLESVKTEGHWARTAFDAAEQVLKQAEDDVAALEGSMRAALTGSQVLSLDDLSRQRSYLVQRREVRDQKQSERDRASETLDSVTEQLKRRRLSVKGLESAQERCAKGLQQVAQRRFWREVDELWNLGKDTGA